jgi:hypothetical protein
MGDGRLLKCLELVSDKVPFGGILSVRVDPVSNDNWLCFLVEYKLQPITNMARVWWDHFPFEVEIIMSYIS